MRIRSASAATFLLLVVSADHAFGQPSTPTAVEYRDKARAALANGDVAGACSLFEQSYQAALHATPTAPVAPDEALFDLADCHETLGKHAIAATEFDQVAASNGGRAND